MVNYITWDVETSGVDLENDRILTAYIKTSDGFEKSWIINPGVEVPRGASDVNGLTTEYIQEHGDPDAEKCIEQIIETLDLYGRRGYVIAGYNHSFDHGMLHYEALRYDMTPLNPEGLIVVDPLVLDRKIDPYRKGGRKLMDVARHYGIKVDEAKLHDAKYDVEVTEKLVTKVLNKTVKKTRNLQGLQQAAILDRLQTLQKEWKMEWAKGITKYFAKTGKTEEDGSAIIVDGSFPWKGAN